MPVLIRISFLNLISEILTGFEIFEFLTKISFSENSTIEFPAPQAGQIPLHLADSNPHSLQRKINLFFFIFN